MALDQHAQEFLDAASRGPSTPLAETSVADLRAAIDALIPVGFEREDVWAVEEQQIAGVPARRYVPEPAVPATVVYLHGGSFVRCGLHTHDTLCRRLANRSGCAVVAVDFSLAPEATYPRQLDEIGSVVEALVRGGATGGVGAPGRVMVAGESSGGNLAAATALRLRDAGGPALAGLVLLVPVLDRDSGTTSRRELAQDYGLSDEQLRWMFDQYAPGAADDDPLVHPFRARDLGGLPPTAVVTAEFDPLRDEGEAFAGRIRAAGARAEYTCIPGTIHHAPLVPRRIPAGAAVVDTAAAFLRTFAA
ncbi:alpha/beta hydrolase [Trujillonella humicola]|uniref:alpha/beta hydrolase n=1 Tax=Trujillonella humicola TaxID=3383699 RepID=UPI003906C392